MSTPTSTSAILVLGGTGTVGRRIVRQLSSSSSPSAPRTILVASREAQPPPPPPPPPPSDNNNNNNNNNNNDTTTTTMTGPTSARGTKRIQPVFFDWNDPATWSNPFSFSLSASAPSITAVYLIAPPSLGADKPMIGFVDLARARGVRRFVLQSASSIEPGGPAMGRVHAYLRGLGQKGEVEWAVLRPTWFQENFADQPAHVRSIRDEDKIYSATGDGKIPWVSADDIAAVAVRVLTSADPPNTDYVVLGPELLSYAEIADVLSRVLGRRIVHVNLSAAELERRLRSFGLPEDYARMLAAMDTAIKSGAEDRTNDVVLAVTGTAPRKFRDFAESVRHVWLADGKV